MFKTIFIGLGGRIISLNEKKCVKIIPTRNARIFRRRPISIIRDDPLASASSLQDYTDKQFSRPGDIKGIIDDEELQNIREKEFMQDDVFSDNIKRNVISHDDKKTKYLLKNVEKSMSSKYINEIVKSGTGGQIKIHGLMPQQYKNNSQMISILKSSRMRMLSEKDDCLFVEGWRIIADFLSFKINIKGLFYSRTNVLAKMNSILKMDNFGFVDYLNSLPLYKTPYDTINAWSSVKTPPGIMAVFSLSSAKEYVSTPKENSIPITVILDNIKDPQNLGGLLRTIAAAGVYRTILTKGCCNPWDIKTIRASSGGIINLHFLYDVEWSRIRNYIPKDSNLYLAHVTQDSESDGVPFKNLSNIPTEGAIFNNVEKKEGEEYFIIDENGLECDHSYDDPEIVSLYRNFKVPHDDYLNVDYFDRNSLILIIGSEAGISPEARKFASENFGSEIYIPMMQEINSLNNNAAAAVILFEMCRQYRIRIKEVVHNKSQQ